MGAMTYPTRDQIVDDGVRDVTSMNLRKTIVVNVTRGIHTTNLFLFSSWKDLLLTGFFLETQQQDVFRRHQQCQNRSPHL